MNSTKANACLSHEEPAIHQRGGAPHWAWAVIRPAGAIHAVTLPSNEGMLICDHRTGQTHLLNGVSAAIWQACDGRTGLDGLAERLTQMFDVDYESALDDVEQLTAKLAELRLLEVA